MGLYAIGDLHLHFQSECKAPMQRTERIWRNHEEVFRKNCARLLTEEDGAEYRLPLEGGAAL